MKSKILASLFLIQFGLLTSSVYAQQTATPDSIETFIKGEMQKRRIPALQYAIVRNGKIIKHNTFGTANLEYDIKASDQTIFSINSITKAFVGVAVMQLAEEKKLKISDPLSKYLDSLPDSWKAITLQQVLTHTSGLPDMEDQDEMILGHNDEQEAMQLVKALPIVLKPGEKFRYNQTGYVLIGQIITKLSGMHFTRFIEERQFNVAGMKLTRFGDSFDVIPNYAGAYTMTRQMGDRFIRNRTPGHAYMQIPIFYRTAAGVQSTATDLGNWIIALKSGKLLKEQASIDSMWKPAILADGKIGGFNRLTNGYALGWPTVTRDEHPAVGPVGGGRSALFVYLKDDLSIIVLTNLMQGNPDQFIDEIAGYYIPDMKKGNGFGLPKSLKKLRAELVKRGFKQAVPIAAELKKKDAAFSLSENELNGWGYELLAQNNADAAVSIMKLMVSMYPNSGNAFDSLAEIQEANGQHADALVSYQQSLRLDPKNKHAADRILVLTK